MHFPCLITYKLNSYGITKQELTQILEWWGGKLWKESKEGARRDENEETKIKEIKAVIIYVILRVSGKKANSGCHYGGKVLGKEGNGELIMKYIRRDYMSEGDLYYLKGDTKWRLFCQQR